MVDKEVQTDEEKPVEQEEKLQVNQQELFNDFFPTQKTSVVAYRDKNGKTVCIGRNTR